MKLVLTRTTWGVLNASNPKDLLPETWEALFVKLQQLKYGALEVSTNPSFALFAGKEDQSRQLREKYGLQLVGQVHSCGYPVPGSASVEDHLVSFATQARAAKNLGASLINSHSGYDAFTLSDSLKFFEGALKLEQELGIPIAHETHRQRSLYSPWVTRDIIRVLPQLKLNADLSHFTCVGERLFDDSLDPAWASLMSALAKQCYYIHSRVGWSQGPQCAQPAAPEFKAEVAAFERWWGDIIRAQLKRGDKVSFISPEHGPAPYQHVKPYTQEPVADVWEINTWVGERVRKLFNSIVG